MATIVPNSFVRMYSLKIDHGTITVAVDTEKFRLKPGETRQVQMEWPKYRSTWELPIRHYAPRNQGNVSPEWIVT
uniref:Peptidase S15 n=1 Tax=Caenorhabditis tropicalis TaxID=1561998 RepID=A0A1I7UFT3_9PELO